MCSLHEFHVSCEAIVNMVRFYASTLSSRGSLLVDLPCCWKHPRSWAVYSKHRSGSKVNSPGTAGTELRAPVGSEFPGEVACGQFVPHPLD